jgi:TetR/AcrR family fatty acid metabolism transcriptional regulator
MGGDERGRKKEAILLAAARVFGLKGYHDATIEEIASEAGVGKGTVYEYFTSKLVLFQAMFTHIADSYLHQVMREPGTTVEQQIRDIMLEHLRFVSKYHEFARVLFGNPGNVTEEMERWIFEQRDEGLSRMRQFLDAGIHEGVLREMDTAVAAEVMGSIMGGMMHKVIFGPPVTDEVLQDMARETCDILLGGISKKS